MRKVDVATAWCRLAADDERVNITKSPVSETDTRSPTFDDYEFYTRNETKLFESMFRVYFIGSSLTGMRRELWLRFPYVTHPATGQQSDVMQSRHLNEAGISIWTHPDAEIIHLKQDPSETYPASWANTEGSPKVVAHHFWKGDECQGK